MLLKVKTKNPIVITIIEWLTFLGYRHQKTNGTFETLKPSEVYDEKVESLIIDFQETVGIFSDGIVGPITIGAKKKDTKRGK